MGEQAHAAGRRARGEARAPLGDTTEVVGVQPVDVLVRRDGGDHRVGVEAARQRQLHQDAVHRRIRAEARDQLEERGLGGVGGQAVIGGGDADLAGVLGLGLDVHGGGGIVADEHDGETGGDAAPGEGGGAHADLVFDLGRDQLAVEDRRGHGVAEPDPDPDPEPEPDPVPDPDPPLGAGVLDEPLSLLGLGVAAVDVSLVVDAPPPPPPLSGFADEYRSLYQPPPLNAKDVREMSRSRAPPHASHSVLAGSLIRCSYSNSRLHAVH